MEPNTSDSAKPKSELAEKNNSQISEATWRDLLHVSIVGNGIFPQSFFAQGILLAEKAAGLVSERKISLNAFLKQNPETDLIFDMMENAKIKSHKVYEINSENRTTDNPVRLWREDKNEARATLSRFAEIVHEIDSDDVHKSDTKQDVLHAVFSNPEELSILTQMLAIARQSLLSQEIKKISNEYKAMIADFMQKYPRNDFSAIPEGYDEERVNMCGTLGQMQEEVKSHIKDNIVLRMQEQHPEDTPFLQRLRKSDFVDLFDLTDFPTIHPLRDLETEQETTGF